MEAVRSGRMTTRGAAKAYSVPNTCLQRRLKDNFTLNGPPTVLTEQEENDIEKWLLDVSTRGFPLTPTELKDSVKTMLDLRGRKTIFKDNRPGRNWFARFLQRKVNLRIRLAENLDKSRAAVTEESIRSWFSEVSTSHFSSQNVREYSQK